MQHTLQSILVIHESTAVLCGELWAIALEFVCNVRNSVVMWSALFPAHCPASWHAHKVAVSGAPVTLWFNYDTGYTERYLGLVEGEGEVSGNGWEGSEGGGDRSGREGEGRGLGSEILWERVV